MSGDNRIGLQAVAGVTRINAARKVGSDEAARTPPSAGVKAADGNVPVSRLIGMASELAEQGPPVDVSRVAALRNAIADKNYTVDPDRIADAMVRFHEDAK